MIRGQRKCSFKIIVPSRFLRFFEVFVPLLRPKVPPWSPYGLIPLSLGVSSATNQNTDVVGEFDSFSSFSQIVMLLWLIFGHF